MSEHYDAMVIGSGQGGTPLARALAEAGRKTALVEREHIGGTCINDGCTPSKTLIASARVAYLARRAAAYGVNTGPVSVDQRRVHARKQAIVDSFRRGSERRIERTPNLDWLHGEARFTGPHSVAVDCFDGRQLELDADLVFVNTGGRPRTLELPGLDTVPHLTSTSIMDLEVTPEHLLVVGGGYIGLEFAQMYRRFGSRVSVVQRSARLLGREDPEVADSIAEVLRQDGIEVLLDTRTISAAPNPDGGIALRVGNASGERTLVGSHLLIAVGRVPNTDRLNLPAAGVQTDDHGYIRVNERLETSAPGIYAIGDVKGGAGFTHISYDDFRILRTNILGAGGATTRNRFIPYVVYTDPQLGRVGLSEQEARAQGRSIRVAKMPMTSVARALEVDETRGFMKAIVDAETDSILGFYALGIEGGEIMSMVEIAMMGNLPYTALRDATFAHPTLAESLNNLFSAFED